MTNDYKVIDLIRKCLALTKSDQPGEAANAMATVQKLLFKHKLTMVDITTAETESPIGEQTVELNARRKEGKWKFALIQGLASYNFCEAILGYDGKRVFIIGNKDEVEALQEIYPWVVEQLIKEERSSWNALYIIDAFKQNCRRPVFRRSFYTGAVAEIRNRLYRQWDSLSKESSASTALVIHNNEAITNYVKERFGETRKCTLRGSASSPQGYFAGRAAGARVSLNRPTRLLTGGGS